MKRPVYAVLGYGVPKNVATDLNYQVYLRQVFNAVYQDVVATGLRPTIICGGGPTDLFRPFRRTESMVMVGELRRYWRVLPLRVKTGWRFVAEAKSLSTLENLLGIRRLTRGTKEVTIFCEITRVPRIGRTARLVFGRSMRVRVVGVEFDVSANRYLDPAFLKKKERAMWDFDQWSVRSPANLRRHHRLYAEKVRRLRTYPPHLHVQGVQEWLTESTQVLMSMTESKQRGLPPGRFFDARFRKV